MTETDNDDYEPWSKEDMEAMLAAGYTPEYVSLVKWVILHKHYVVTKCMAMSWLNGSNCSLCSKYCNHADTSCDECTLYNQMGMTCNHEDHPYVSVRWGSVDDLIPNMVEMIKQLTILVVKHGVMIDGKST